MDNVKYFVCLRQLKPIVGCAIGASIFFSTVKSNYVIVHLISKNIGYCVKNDWRLLGFFSAILLSVLSTKLEFICCSSCIII